MTLSVKVAGVEVAGSVLLEDGSFSLVSSADGEPGVGPGPDGSEIRVDDPEGTWSFTEHSTVEVEDDGARLGTGIAAVLNIERASYRNLRGRVWVLGLTDLNEMLHRRILTGADADRDAETGSERLAWLLTTEGMAGVVFDNGKIMANAWEYGPADYRGEYADEVLASIIAAATDGRWTFFLYWDPDASPGEEISLFYGEATATIHDSPLKISNVLSDRDDIDDPDAIVFAPHVDGTHTEEAEGIYTGVLVIWQGGQLYRERASTIATYGTRRDYVLESPRINNVETASRHAETFLDTHDGGAVTVTCTVQLPRAKVALLDAGMRVQVRFQHLVGYESFTWTRVSRRTLKLSSGTNRYYDVELELSTRGINPALGGGSPPLFPYQPGGCTTGDFDTNDLAFGKEVSYDPADSTGGRYGPIPDGTGATDHNDGATGIFGAGASGYAGGPRFNQYDIDLGSAQKVGEAQVWDPGPDPNLTGIGGLEGLEVWASDDGSSFHQVTAVADWIDRGMIFEPIPASNHHCWGVPIPSAEQTHRYWGFRWKQNFISGFWGGYQFNGLRLIECVGDEPQPPWPGQWVYGETVTPAADGTTTTFYTAWPFANGSLQVIVGGIAQPPLSTDGAAGSFVMAFAPTDAGEQPIVSYQGR